MATLFLYIFFVGFGLTVVSAVLGAVDAGMDHGGSVDAGGPDGVHGHGAHGHVTAVSAVNFQTVVAFLMGFGGVGYLTLSWGPAGYLLALPVAVAGGVGTATLIYRFLRFLTRGERPMGQTDYEGLIGHLTVGIREGGTGEMVYSLHGTRMVTAARSQDGSAIAKGSQVLVLRYEKGIAFVQPFSGTLE